MFKSVNNRNIEGDRDLGSRPFVSRIFVRIAAGTFISILLIEIILLTYSWVSERDRLLVRQDETLQSVISVIDKNNPVPQLDSLLKNTDIGSKANVVGYAFRSVSGAVSSGGTMDQTADQVTAENPFAFDRATGKFSKLSTDSFLPPQQLVLQVDASWINAYMNSYIARILGMVVLISLFVTVACLIFLKPILINPLLRLDRMLVRSQSQGIKKATATTQDLGRTDELGSVFRSFDLLRNKLVVAELKNTEVTQRFESFANMGADCFWETNSRGEITYVAGETRKILMRAPDELIGKNFSNIVQDIGEHLPTAASIRESLISTGSWEGDVDADSSLTIRIMATPVKSNSNWLQGFRGTIKDISKETELSRELTYQATHDELTGLFNRREFNARLKHSVDLYESEGTTFCLMILDLDRFKLVNDTSGHAAGDALLRSLSDIFTSAVKKGDTVARLGGDEFGVLLPNMDIQQATECAEKFRGAVEGFHFPWDQTVHRVSVSIGLAEVGPNLSSSESITLAADSCCIDAKNSGKNQLRVFSDGTDVEKISTESMWVSRIGEALEKPNVFKLFRQSIVRIDKPHKEEHFEILLRMQDSENGFWPPNEFLPVAERNDLMPQIDSWVVKNAYEWLATQEIPTDKEYCMNINLSATSLSSSEFRKHLLEYVVKNRSLNQYVCFEMTETSAMMYFEETVSLLNSLRKEGCRIALDDFGTGFSSLSHIRDLPLDYIKIDGLFIKELESNELDQAVVKSVSEMAKVLKIKTVAEFVDSEKALGILEEMNIDYAQGFLFSKPEQLEQSRDDREFKKAA